MTRVIEDHFRKKRSEMERFVKKPPQEDGSVRTTWESGVSEAVRHEIAGFLSGCMHPLKVRSPIIAARQVVPCYD